MTFRRTALTALAVGSAMSLALAGCGSNKDASSGNSDKVDGGKVTVYASGDLNVKSIWQDTLIPSFKKASPQYDVKLIFSEHGVNDETTLAKMGAAAKTNSDPGIDLSDGLSEAALSGWTEKVSTDNVPNLKNIDAKLLEPVQSGAVPYRASVVVLAYDSNKVPTPPKTLDELLAWIKANPGKFTYNTPSTGGSGGAFVTTVLDKFVPPDVRAKMETSYDASMQSNWAEGFKMLHSLTPSIYQHVYPNGNQNVVDLLAKGQITMAPVWSSTGLSELHSGLLPASIKLTRISDPSFPGGPSYLVIPKTANNKAGALALANFILEPAQQAAIAASTAEFPVVPIAQLPQDVQDQFRGMNADGLRPTYFGSHVDDMNRLWQQKVPG
jgi:putative spermidine/putrescine transport system substrate-binding protein